MTANQIAYWNYVENQRHNLSTEAEQNRSNLAQEEERKRANLASERLTKEQNTINRVHLGRMDSETNRHNVATESAAVQQDLTRQRSNDVSELSARLHAETAYAQTALGYANLAETSRANQAREIEINRSNLENERQNVLGLSTKAVEAKTNALKAKTDAGRLALDSEKWTTVGKDTAMVELRNKNLQGVQTGADIDLTKAQTKAVPINAASNAVGAASRLVQNLRIGRLKK